MLIAAAYSRALRAAARKPDQSAQHNTTPLASTAAKQPSRNTQSASKSQH
ncbi:MAG: hypothetical protein V4650_08095 [Pseudomonadota bacterium]